MCTSKEGDHLLLLCSGFCLWFSFASPLPTAAFAACAACVFVAFRSSLLVYYSNMYTRLCTLFTHVRMYYAFLINRKRIVCLDTPV